MIVANPAIATTTGWPVGFWAAELTHTYYEFVKKGIHVTIASPGGGKLELDSYSDPRHESGYSAHDLISMGFLNTPSLMSLIENTPKLSEVKDRDFDAVVVVGGQSPMWTFTNNAELHQYLAASYESGKIMAAMCHGVAALLYTSLSDGRPLVEGRRITGFSNEEENIVDQTLGQKLMPWRIEDKARAQGAHYSAGPAFQSYVVRDGRLITGQQQNSGAETARHVIEAIGLQPK